MTQDQPTESSTVPDFQLEKTNLPVEQSVVPDYSFTAMGGSLTGLANRPADEPVCEVAPSTSRPPLRDVAASLGKLYAAHKGSTKNLVVADTESYDGTFRTEVSLRNCHLGTLGFMADIFHMTLEGEDTGHIPHRSLEEARMGIVKLRQLVSDHLGEESRAMSHATRAYPRAIKIICVVQYGGDPSVCMVQIFTDATQYRVTVPVDYCTVDADGGILHAFAVSARENGGYVVLLPDGARLEIPQAQVYGD